MWVFNLEEGAFLAVNKATCNRYGYTEEEFMAMTIFDIRPPSHIPMVEASLAKLRAGIRTEEPHTWEHRTKSGQRLMIEVLSTVIDLGEVMASFAVLRDVTREHELKAEQSRFFELSKDMMVIRNLDGQVTSINAAAIETLGWSQEELSIMRPLELVHPDDIPARFGGYSAVATDGSDGTWEGRIRAKDGKYHWVQWSAVIDKDLERYYSVARDVSERHAIGERLRANEENLAWAQRVSHLGSWSFDSKTKTFTLSDEYYRITGSEPGDYAPTWENILARVHPDDRHLVEVDETIFTPAWTRKQFEVRVVRPSGEIRNVVSFVDAVFNSENGLETVLGTLQDVTDQKRAQETQNWLAEIVSSSSDAIVGKGLDGTVLSWNKAAERLFGYSEAEMVGRSVRTVVPPHRQGELDKILALIRKGEYVREFETERVDSSGRIFEVTLTVSPIQTDSGQIIGAATIVRDISARKEADRQLASRIAQLTALHRIDLSITGTFELLPTLEVVVTQTLATTDVQTVFLFVRDPETGEARLATSGSASTDTIDLQQLDRATAHAQEAMERRSLSRSLVDDDASPEGHLTFEGRPLVAKGKANGALVVSHQGTSRRCEEQARFLDTLTEQAAIAVESARLFEELQNSHDALEAAYDETLEGWARALDLRDHETEGHSRRVTDLTMRMAERIDLPAEDLIQIRRGALLHDIGKLGVPDFILSKPGPLTEGEWMVMRKHPGYGRDILAPISFLKDALDIPYSHHEKWDGSGYPKGLRGEEIPLSARVFALADVWDALTSDRPYRKGWPTGQVCDYIQTESGRHFDPSLVPIFLNLVGEDQECTPFA